MLVKLLQLIYIMKLRTRLIFILSIVFGLSSKAQDSEYGIYIQSYPKPTSDFTSLVLDNGNPIDITKEKLTLSFKIWNRKENAFGTVLRIITNQGKNIDVMYSVHENETEKRYPMLVIGDEVHTISQNIPYESWMDVQLILDTETSSVTLSYNNSIININNPHIANTKSIRIAFGLCPFEGYVLDNVASVNLKDITLYRENEMIRQWKMGFHQQDTCYDEINQHPAISSNAIWLLDKHITWKQVYQKGFSHTPMITFDSIQCLFYVTDEKNELHTFRPLDATENILVSNGGKFAATYPNQLMYIPQAEKVLSFNLDENLFSFFNLQAQQWENKQVPSTEHKQNYWNSTITYHDQDSILVSFGGYGHFHYNNDLTISYPYKNKAIQKQKKIREIHPRFSSASAIVDGNLYIFGGRGCPSGKAELSPKNYYDLYSINLNTLETTLLWSTTEEPTNGHFLPSDNMIYDSDNDCFYVFCTQEGGKLMKIKKEKAGFEDMSLPIYQSINAQYLYTNLYYSPKQEKLYSVIQQTQVDGSTNLQIFELDFPPLPVKTLHQDTISLKDNHNSTWFIILCFCIVFTTIGSIYLYFKQRKKKPMKDHSDCSSFNKKVEKEENSTKDEISLTVNDIPEFHNYNLERQSIRFFGGFKVMDSEGNDITISFTPTLKALLILIILYTGKDAKGISGQKLIQLLWFDKMEESAKNNRNVYISKLRNLLEKVGDVTIVNKNGFWSIHFENNCLCDYLEALRLYQQNDSQDLEKLVELLLHGMMLPNMEIDWIDKFKSDFSNQTIDLLSRVLKREDLPDNFRLKIADTLFQHDYINEEALAEKCRILYKQGKKGLAKTIYDSFCKEYSVSLGTEYPTSLMDLISSQS